MQTCPKLYSPNYEALSSEVSTCCLSGLISQLQKWSVTNGNNFFLLDNKGTFSWISHFHNTAGFNYRKSNEWLASLVYATKS